MRKSRRKRWRRESLLLTHIHTSEAADPFPPRLARPRFRETTESGVQAALSAAAVLHDARRRP